MFVPSIEALSNKLNFDRSSLGQDGTVRVPAAMLKFLLQIALTAVKFDEGAYLKESRMSREAVERGDIESGQLICTTLATGTSKDVRAAAQRLMKIGICENIPM